MREKFICGAVWAAVLSAMACAASAQEKTKAADMPVAPVPAPAKVRAFTGHWQNDNAVFGLTKPGVAPLTPRYEAKLQELVKLALAGDEVPGNEPKCIPNGLPMTMAFDLQIFADASQMVVISSGPRVRYVWLDGRKHTADDFLFESYDGESVGTWEGDTLVVDTIGLKPTNELIFGVSANNTLTHIIERWRMVSPATLQIQTTIENPEALTKPWIYTRSYSRRPATIETQYCTSTIDRARDGGFDLTPPAGGFVPSGAKE